MPLPWKRNLPPEPSPEEAKRSHTEKIAYELSQTRQLLKRPGDPTTDWATAEKIVKNPVRKALYRCHRPLIRLEKNTWEPLLAWANNQALLSLLGLVGNIGLIIAVATYIGSEKQRRNAEVLNAWQTITSAHGQAGSGGRIQSLEFLNASPGANWRRKFPWFCAPVSICLWQAESLDGIDLSIGIEANSLPEKQSALFNNHHSSRTVVSAIYLRRIKLPRASLIGANLEGVDLWKANLKGAKLGGANLEGANLEFAKLQGAILVDANLKGANLESANLKGANLSLAVLERADLVQSNLERADLENSSLEGVDLLSANLDGANLESSNLKGASLEHANLEGANLRRSQLKGAFLFGTHLEAAVLIMRSIV